MPGDDDVSLAEKLGGPQRQQTLVARPRPDERDAADRRGPRLTPGGRCR
jgi:hypothetical protein